MKNRFYAVKCLTNLHMGSGDVNFNIVDNEVQRDPVTGYPTMHSSGMKGAFREYFRGASPEDVKGIFGADMKVELLNDGPFTIILDSENIVKGDKNG